MCISENALKNICKTQKEIVENTGNLWQNDKIPSLWHYLDDSRNLLKNTTSRILLVYKEIDKKFQTSML